MGLGLDPTHKGTPVLNQADWNLPGEEVKKKGEEKEEKEEETSTDAS